MSIAFVAKLLLSIKLCILFAHARSHFQRRPKCVQFFWGGNLFIRFPKLEKNLRGKLVIVRMIDITFLAFHWKFSFVKPNCAPR